MRGYGLLFAAVAMSAACANFSEDGQDDGVTRGSATHRFVGSDGTTVHATAGQVSTTVLPVGPYTGSGSGLPDPNYGVAAISVVDGDLRDPTAYVRVETDAGGYFEIVAYFPIPSDGTTGGGDYAYTYASWTDDLGLTDTQLHHLDQYVDSYSNPTSPGSGGSNVNYPNFCTWGGFAGPLTRYDQVGSQRSAVDFTTGSDSRLIVVDGVTSEPITTYAWCAEGVPPGVQNLATNTHGTSNTSPTWLSFQRDQAWCYVAGASSNGVNNYLEAGSVAVENDGSTPTWEVTGAQVEANCLKPL